MQKPNQADLLVAHHTQRKCEQIADAAFAAFRKAAEEWGTLSLDELLGIGTTLFMRITVQPWENAAKDRNSRRLIRKQLRALLTRAMEDGAENAEERLN